MENNVIDRENDQVASQQKHQPSEFRYNPPPPSEPEENGLKLNDFLNPRSMLSPGIAGSLVMLIANTLWVQFMVPQKWSALALSFLLIIPILVKFAVSILESSVYFIFNGLIVFSLAVNTNFVGSKLQELSNRVDEVSLDTQKLNSALKNSLVVAAAETDHKITKINRMPLAYNDDGEMGHLQLAAEDRRGDKTDSSKQEKKDHEKNKHEKHRNNRQFFGNKWF